MNHALDGGTGLTDQAGNARKRKKMRHGKYGPVAPVVAILAIGTPVTKWHAHVSPSPDVGGNPKMPYARAVGSTILN